MLKFSACSESCKKKSMLKFQHVLKTVKKYVENFNMILKTVTHVEKVCLKFQRLLKTVMHAQNYVEYFRVC